MDFLRGKVEEGKIAKFWLPDKIEIVDSIPKTGTGKFNKKAMRAKYWGRNR